MAYCQLSDGVPLYYRDEGQGRPVVLLHALMFQADYFWQRNISELAKSNRVIAPDLRGQGLSGKPNHGYTIPQLAADLDEFAKPIRPLAPSHDAVSVRGENGNSAVDATMVAGRYRCH